MKANECARERLERDTAAFLEKGGEIDVIPTGLSGEHLSVTKASNGTVRYTQETQDAHKVRSRSIVRNWATLRGKG